MKLPIIPQALIPNSYSNTSKLSSKCLLQFVVVVVVEQKSNQNLHIAFDYYTSYLLKSKTASIFCPHLKIFHDIDLPKALGQLSYRIPQKKRSLCICVLKVFN